MLGSRMEHPTEKQFCAQEIVQQQPKMTPEDNFTQVLLTTEDDSLH